MARFSGGAGGGSGIPGPVGPAGDSAYEIAVENGFEGTEQEWLDSLSGSANTGDFVFDDATMYTQVDGDTFIQARDDEGKTSAELVFDPGNDRTYLRAYGNFSEDTYYDTDWDTATWTAGEGESSSLALTGASSIFTFLDSDFRQYNRRISINGGPLGVIDGWGSDGTDGSLYIIGIETSNEPITSIAFSASRGSTFEIDYDDDEMNITAQGLDIFIESSSGNDIEINSGDDLDLRAEDDIRFYANTDETQRSWSMNSEGELHLPGNGYISNPADSSGDGNNYDTIHIIPDENLVSNDQYLIIDPTQPNHIHIRAGGTQDASQADLILGAERTNLLISDLSGQVSISSKTIPDILIFENVSSEPGNTFSINEDLVYLLDSPRPGTNFIVDGNTRYNVSGWSVVEGVTTITVYDFIFTPNFFYGVGRDYGDVSWNFSNDGYLYGPADGRLAVQGILGPSSDSDLEIIAPSSIVLNGQFGEFLDSSGDPNNQIATIGDLGNAVGIETSFEVLGGTTGDGAVQPTFNGNPLFSGSYVKSSANLVYFQIQVDFDNITSFGIGQYYVQLPFAAKYGTMLREGCLHRASNGRQYAISGHVLAGSNILTLWYTSTTGEDEPFDHNSPYALQIEDNFHVSGSYIIEE